MAKKMGYAKYRFNPLKKITAKAKQLKKLHPNTKWTDLIKKASATLQNERRLSRTRKRVTRVKRSTAPKRRKKVVGAFSKSMVSGIEQFTQGQMIGAIRRKSENKLGKLYVQRDKQTTKTGRRKISKKIAAVKANIRKFC